MASTGDVVPARRGFLKALVVAPAGALVLVPRAEATDYASAREVMDTVDRLEADVAARLGAIARAVPRAQPFAGSVLADFERHRAVRARLRRRLGLPASAAPSVVTKDAGLEPLRAAQEALVYAHAEGLPALGDAHAVDAMARNMVELSRHLAVIGLWIESESERG